MKKERVDVLAFNQGLFETREKAKRSVMAGLVYNVPIFAIVNLKISLKGCRILQRLMFPLFHYA